jgi:homoserine O-succinyltransferase
MSFAARVAPPFEASPGVTPAPCVALRVGIINIMPRAETYEAYLARPLSAAPVPVQPVWLRLESHVYSSSDVARVGGYVTQQELEQQAPLDALILTGAPVEELAFEDVRYIDELRAILEGARQRRVPTLGLCWGGLALGHLLGLPKVSFERKLFGVFEQTALSADHPLLEGLGAHFPCVHSRHSGIPDAALERARDEGRVELLAGSAETGYTVFASSDGLYVAHLGHPEYPATRLREEWERDTALGRIGIEPPRNYDTQQPQATWAPHSDRFFANWLLAAARKRRPAMNET